jgi:hypothetical protein
MPGGGDLYFCAHHGREHAERLRAVAIEIHDSTGALDNVAATPEEPLSEG